MPYLYLSDCWIALLAVYSPGLQVTGCSSYIHQNYFLEGFAKSFHNLSDMVYSSLAPPPGEVGIYILLKKQSLVVNLVPMMSFDKPS